MVEIVPDAPENEAMILVIRRCSFQVSALYFKGARLFVITMSMSNSNAKERIHLILEWHGWLNNLKQWRPSSDREYDGCGFSRSGKLTVYCVFA